MRSFAGQPHSFACHLQFRSLRAPGQLLDLCPVFVAGDEIHGLETGNSSEGFVHQADSFEEFRPVDGRDPTHAGDDVLNRDVRCGLILVCLGNHLVWGRPLRSQILVEPVESRHHRSWLVAKPPHELHRERTVEGSGVKPSQDIFQAFRRLIAEAQKVIRQFVRLRARLAGADDRLREPSEVFNEGDPKVDGDCPEFTDAERLDALVGPNECL